MDFSVPDAVGLGHGVILVCEQGEAKAVFERVVVNPGRGAARVTLIPNVG
jgi:hypothetical protein